MADLFRAAVVTPANERGKAVVHVASILFFLMLLVALMALLDSLVRSDLDLIRSALRGPERRNVAASGVRTVRLRALS